MYFLERQKHRIRDFFKIHTCRYTYTVSQIIFLATERNLHIGWDFHSKLNLMILIIKIVLNNKKVIFYLSFLCQNNSLINFINANICITHHTKRRYEKFPEILFDFSTWNANLIGTTQQHGWFF